MVVSGDGDATAADGGGEEGGAAAEEGVLLCKDAPELQTYFKMKKMRIPEGSIKQKMDMEGFDPNLLDTPDAPWPYATE